AISTAAKQCWEETGAGQLDPRHPGRGPETRRSRTEAEHRSELLEESRDKRGSVRGHIISLQGQECSHQGLHQCITRSPEERAVELRHHP
ncbi:unnamed protein product, partial [Sphacelaria rigidula]